MIISKVLILVSTTSKTT